MSTVPIARSALTTQIVTYLVDALKPAEILVGRGLAPAAGGWDKGQPGTSGFVKYVTLKTGNAVTPSQGEPNPVGRTRASWDVSYQLTSVGAMESHADDTGDQVRFVIVDLPKEFTLRGFHWTLQQVRTLRLGPTIRNDSTDPAFWEVTDDVSLQLSLDRTP